MKNNCENLKSHFGDYIDGLLNEKCKADLNSHIAECKDCFSTLARYKSVISILDSTPEIDLPKDFHVNTIRAIKGSISSKIDSVPWWKIDWTQFLSIKIPVRAVVNGFVLLFIYIVLMNIFPVHTITAGLLPAKTSQHYKYSAPDNMKMWGPWGTSIKRVAPPAPKSIQTK